MARRVGEDGVRPAGDHDGADGEPVEPVGQVDGVGGADDHQRAEGDVPEAEVRPHVLQERHGELPPVSGAAVERHRRGPGDRELAGEAQPSRESLRVSAAHLRVVVEEADPAVAERHP